MDMQSVKTKLDANLTPIIQAGANLIDSSRKGVGKILNAFVGPWVANRERNIALLQAQTEKDCADIQNGTKVYRERKLLDSPNLATDGDPYDTLHTLNHMADAKRLQAAVEEALRQISDVPPGEISDEPICQTFFNRWRREAEMIDEDDLRQFWTALLVEETKKPNSISPGTLDVARNLTRADALLFQKLCRGVVGNALIVDGKDNPINGEYLDLLRLQDAGLLNSHQSTKTTTSRSKPAAELFVSLRLAICSESKELRYTCYTLTRAGTEIMRTIPVGRTEEDVISMAKTMAGYMSPIKLSVLRTEECQQPDGRVAYRVMPHSPIWSSVGVN